MTTLDINSGQIVANASETARSTFIKRTYLHVAGAFAVFAVLETMLIKAGFGEQMLGMLQKSPFSWLIVLGAFMGVSYIADKWARSAVSKATQYMGLGLFVVAEAIIFLPMMYMAAAYAPDILKNAVIVTAALTAGITFTAFTTKKDFSFLGSFLKVGGIVAIGVIVASIVFGFTLGTLFSGIMILFAGASILYSTSNIIHHYHTEQYVAASLSLFSGIALLLWYVVQFMMSMANGD